MKYSVHSLFNSLAFVCVLLYPAVVNGQATGSQVDAQLARVHSAIEKGDLKQVESFLKRKINVNERNELGETFLMVAARAGNVEIVKFLLEKGADRTAVDRTGRSAERIAIQYRKHEVLDVLRKTTEAKDSAASARSPSKNRPVGTAAHALSKTVEIASRKGDAATVEKAIAQGFQIDTRIAGSATALMIAAESGSIEVIEVLLEYRADPKLRDGWGRSARSRAERAGKAEAVLLLKRAEGLPEVGQNSRVEPNKRTVAPGATPGGKRTWNSSIVSGAVKHGFQFATSVDGDRVERLSFRGAWTCKGFAGSPPKSEPARFEYPLGIKIEKGAFSQTVIRNELEWAIEGRFTSATTSEGTLQLSSRDRRCSTGVMRWSSGV